MGAGRVGHRAVAAAVAVRAAGTAIRLSECGNVGILESRWEKLWVRQFAPSKILDIRDMEVVILRVPELF